MRRASLLLAVCLAAGGVTSPLLAQKNAPAVTRDADRDGVPDIRDRCRSTPAGTRVDATGCPATAAPAAPVATTATPATATPDARRGQTTPTTTAPATTAAQAPTTAAPGGVTPAGAAGAAQAPPGAAPAGQQAAAPPTQQAAQPTGRPSGLPAPTSGGAPTGGGAAPVGAVVGAAGAAATQAARGNQPPATAQPAATTASPATATPAATTPAPATTAPAPAAAAPAAAAPARTRPAPVLDPSLTAGYWMPAYNGETDAELLEYARTMTIRTDSAIGALVEVFRNTTGAPVVGATGPNILATREKGRWQRCRLIHFDLGTLGEGATFLRDTLTNPTLNRAALTLVDAFEGETASSECDNITSMVEAPDRWAPWQQNYESSARTFYRDWYGQLKTLHDANRGFARALNSTLPAARQFPIFPALPPTPPTIGAVR
jgi:hypothetical protein